MFVVVCPFVKGMDRDVSAAHLFNRLFVKEENTADVTDNSHLKDQINQPNTDLRPETHQERKEVGRKDSKRWNGSERKERRDERGWMKEKRQQEEETGGRWTQLVPGDSEGSWRADGDNSFSGWAVMRCKWKRPEQFWMWPLFRQRSPRREIQYRLTCWEVCFGAFEMKKHQQRTTDWRYVWFCWFAGVPLERNKKLKTGNARRSSSPSAFYSATLLQSIYYTLTDVNLFFISASLLQNFAVSRELRSSCSLNV